MHIKLYPTLKRAFVAASLLLAGNDAFAQAAPYCTPTTGTACADGSQLIRINSVSTTGAVTNISNANNACQGAYTRYSGTGYTVVANAGSTITPNVVTSIVGTTSWWGRCIIWVDWSGKDNSFAEPGDQVFVSRTQDAGGPYPNSGAPTKNFVVPTSAKEGMKRMRVRFGTTANGGTAPGAWDPCSAGSMVFGEVEDYDFYVVNPCLMNPFNIENITDHSYDVKFRRRGNAEMYEYFVSDTLYNNSTPPNGWSLTTDSLIKFPNASTPVECDKKYYIYIRTICDTAGLNQNDWVTSPWRIDSVTTPPCCYVPDVTITDVTSTGANVTWTPVPTVYKYEYIVSATDQTPTGSGTFTSSTGVTLSGLAPSKEWYFFLRAYCNPTPTSSWGLDSFLTGFPLNISNTTGVSDFGITAYPNPVKDVVKLQLNYGSMIAGKAKVIVTDITGKLITTAEMEKDVLELNLSGKPAGTYIIKYTDDAHTHVMHVYKQ